MMPLRHAKSENDQRHTQSMNPKFCNYTILGFFVKDLTIFKLYPAQIRIVAAKRMVPISVAQFPLERK
jgi:hypothetical protein